MFPSTAGIEDVTSYAVHRPDGNWSLMLVNRNETSPHTISVVIQRFEVQRGFAGR
jgi:hypothetical protein